MVWSRRLMIVSFTAAGLLAAGCAGPADDPTAGTDPAPTVALDFGAPAVVIPLRNVQSEAFIDVSHDASTRLTCLHGEFKEPSIMLASEDSGSTWRELTASPSPGVGGDCEVALSGDAGWHFVHTQAAGIVITSTFDAGSTWRVDPLTGPPVATFSDRPWLESAGKRLVLSYAGFAGLQTRVSDDEGATWTLPQVPVRPEPGYLALPGHLKIGADGKTVVQPYMHVSATGPGEGVDRVAPGVGVSTDLGRTWTDHRLDPLTGLRLHPAAAVSPDGSIHLAYYAVGPNGTSLVLRTSYDAGRAWSEPVVLQDGLGRVSRPWADARPDGRVDVLFMTDSVEDAAAEAPWALRFLRVDPQEPSRIQAKDLAFLPRVNEFVSLTHDADGRAYVVYTDVRGGSLTMPPADGSVLWTIEESGA